MTSLDPRNLKTGLDAIADTAMVVVLAGWDKAAERGAYQPITLEAFFRENAGELDQDEVRKSLSDTGAHRIGGGAAAQFTLKLVSARCPECGAFVGSMFDHVDRDCPVEAVETVPST